MEPKSKALTKENSTREATGFIDGSKMLAREPSLKGLRNFARLHRDECIIGAGIGTGIGFGVIGEAASSRSCYYFPTIWIFSRGDYAWACSIPLALAIAVASTAAVLAATVVLHRNKHNVEEEVKDSLTSREKIKYGTLSLGSMALLVFSLDSILGMSKNIEEHVSTYFGGLGIVNSWELVFVAIPLATLGISYGLKKLNQTPEQTTDEDAPRSGFKIINGFIERHRDAALTVSSTGTGMAMMLADNTISNGLGQQTVPAEVLLIAGSAFATAYIAGRIGKDAKSPRL